MSPGMYQWCCCAGEIVWVGGPSNSSSVLLCRIDGDDISYYSSYTYRSQSKLCVNADGHVRVKVYRRSDSAPYYLDFDENLVFIGATAAPNTTGVVLGSYDGTYHRAHVKTDPETGDPCLYYDDESSYIDTDDSDIAIRRLLFTDDGRPYIFYQSIGGGYYKEKRAVRQSDGTWDSQTVFSYANDGSVPITPRTSYTAHSWVLRPNGNIANSYLEVYSWATYNEARNAFDYDNIYTIHIAGYSDSHNTQTNYYLAIDSDVCVDSDGYVHGVYSVYDSYTQESHFYYVTNESGDWVKSTIQISLAHLVGIQCGRDGKPIVVCYPSTGNMLTLKKSGSTWVTVYQGGWPYGGSISSFSMEVYGGWSDNQDGER